MPYTFSTEQLPRYSSASPIGHLEAFNLQCHNAKAKALASLAVFGSDMSTAEEQYLYIFLLLLNGCKLPIRLLKLNLTGSLSEAHMFQFS